MLRLCELRRAVEALACERRGARVEKVSEPDPRELELLLAGGERRPASDRARLVLSCRAGAGRIGLRARARRAPETPPAFAQYLRAHLRGARLADAFLRGGDRQAVLRLEAKEGRLDLLLALMGARSNLYLLDGSETLVAALRPLPETRRDLALGEAWRDPEPPPRREEADRFAEVPDAGLLEAIERHYAERESSERREGREQRLRQALAKRRKGLERKLEKLEAEAGAAEEAPALERRGELLKTVLAEVGPRQSEVRARDFETGELVTIPLDPSLAPAENLERIFQRARKLGRRALKAGQEIGATRERLDAVRALERELGALGEAGAPDPEALARLEARPDVRRLLERYAPGPAPRERAPRRPAWRIGKRELPARLVPKRYRTSDGLEVWVGKSDEGNDLLTTRLARGRDLFLHLEHEPGSHVILRTEGRADPPPASLLEAAELAVHFSKHRRAPRATVHVVPVKNVSKPKGAKPGLVYVRGGRTLELRREAARLQRILSARIDEASGEAGARAGS